MKNFGRNLMFWLAIALVLAFLINVFQSTQQQPVGSGPPYNYSDFMADAAAGHISDVIIKGQEISGHLNTDNGREFRTLVPENENVVSRLEALKANGVVIKVQKPEGEPVSIFTLLMYYGPPLLLIGFWIYMFRQMQGKGGGGAMGFGKSRARLLTEAQGRVTFEDVAGIEEAKVELQEVVEFLKDPQKFQRLGGKIPKGALLIGPPGTGKTLVARAVAGEANVPFFTISGSDFVEMFVGVGASRVRDMFEQAKKNAPCIIFIDEIDAVGRHRGAGIGGGNDEREQTLNQLLVEMDGFEANEGIIIVAATNRPDVLDTALLRPGRFDRQVYIPLPDVKGREKILGVHIRKVPLGKNVDLSVLARGTPGFSGADLANLVNEAALLAARRGKRVVGMDEFEHAKDKVMMGVERLSLAMNEEEKKNTAYHEAGHAIVALHEPESDPIHKATIVPRGRALGMVVRLPEGDRYSTSFAKLKAHLSVGMGGRVAEELIFGADKVTTGASGDIQMVTNTARKMVTEWGMSDEIGMVDYGEDDHHDFYRSKRISSATSATIEKEVRRLIDEAYAQAKKILTENITELHTLAKALLEYELLTGDEIKALLRGEAIIRDDNTEEEPGARPKSSVPTTGSSGGGNFGPGEVPQGA